MNDELVTILKKVLSLYRKYGIRSVTMDDVSRELGISKKTLYQYVQDKDELVKLALDKYLDEFTLTIGNICRDDLNAIEELFAINQCTNVMLKDYNPATEYDLKKYYPDIYVKARETRRNTIYKVIYDNLKKGKAEGIYRMEVNEEVLAKLYVSRIDCLSENEIFSISEYLNPKFHLEVITYHIRGISNEKGLSILGEQLTRLNSFQE